MKTVERKVYYCEYCKKHGLSAHWIRQHELHCTLNRYRVCGLCGRVGIDKPSLTKLKNKMKWLMGKYKDFDSWGKSVDGKYQDKFKKLVEEIEDDLSCPACTFAVIRQADALAEADYDYKTKLQEYWDEKNADEDREPYGER